MIKDMLRTLLDPGKEGVEARYPECSMVQLFKNGEIPWDTLQKITYQDCEL